MGVVVGASTVLNWRASIIVLASVDAWLTSLKLPFLLELMLPSSKRIHAVDLLELVFNLRQYRRDGPNYSRLL